MTLHTLYERGAIDDGPVLLVHGGAGPRTSPMSPRDEQECREGLQAALAAGSAALREGATALDAVCAAVVELEDNPMFNAGRGATLTSAGTAELDAAVMTGDGRAGAIAVSKHIRNPILGARTVCEQTDHVLIVEPSEQFAKDEGLPTVPTDHFITPARQQQLQDVLARRAPQERHGTVGAVALDRTGQVACATSTGGMVAQALGRVGDTALIGAGSFARNGNVAVSCTGEGEAYIRGCVAHDISARIRYSGDSLAPAVQATYAAELDSVHATGGTIALTPRGEAVIVHNSGSMFAGYWTAGESGVFV